MHPATIPMRAILTATNILNLIIEVVCFMIMLSLPPIMVYRERKNWMMAVFTGNTTVVVHRRPSMAR
jgi:hypothetical protein